MLIWYTRASAEDDMVIVENYLESFNECQETTIPAGWDLVNNLPEGSTFAYKMVTGGQSLSTPLDNWTPEMLLHAAAAQPSDGKLILMSPALSGQVKFVVKADSYTNKGPVKVYAMAKDENGDWVAGQLLKEIKSSDFSNSYTWYEHTVQLADFTRIGFEANYAKIDNVKAEQAFIPAIMALTISPEVPSAVGVASSPGVIADEEGIAHFQLATRFFNYGTTAIGPDMPNATLDILGENDEIICTLPFTRTINPGTVVRDTLEVQYALPDPAADIKNVKFKIRENIFGTISGTATVNFRALASCLSLRDGSFVLSHDSPRLIGLMKAGKTKIFNFQNTGTAPLTVSDLTLPQGVTTEHELPFTVEPGANEDVEFVFNLPQEGHFVQEIVVSHNGGSLSNNHILYRVAYVYDDTYSADFAGSAMPVAWLNGGTLNGVSKPKFSVSSSNGNSYIFSSGEAFASSPLLTFGENGKLTFGAARNSTWGTQTLNVYCSADRGEWYLLKSLSTEDEPMELDATSGLMSLRYFTIDIPEGNWHIGFLVNGMILDDIFGGVLTPGVHDILMEGLQTVGSAMVNYPYTVKIPIRNIAAETEPAGAYSVRLESDGKLLSETTDTPELPYSENTQTIVELSFIPSEPNEALPLKAVITRPLDNGVYSTESPQTTIRVNPEVLSTETTVGELTMRTNTNVPMRGTYNFSASKSVYRAEQLGIPEGSVITKIAYKFKKTGTKEGCIRNIRVWLANTDETEVDKNTVFSDTTSMSPVFVGNFDHSTTFPDYSDLEMPFDEPFTYTGGNLKVVFRTEDHAKKWSGTDFYSFIGSNNQSVYGYNDNYTTYRQFTGTQLSTTSELPVIILYLQATAPTVSGKVVVDGTPLENARLDFASGAVHYYGTTDSEGEYSVEILQKTLDYTLTAAASAHCDISFPETNYPDNVRLEDIEMLRNELNAEEYFCSIGETTNEIELSWTPLEPGSLDEAITYTVMLDGVPIAENIEDCEYRIGNVAAGEHTVAVKAVFHPSMLESSPVEATMLYTSAPTLSVGGNSIIALKGGVAIETTAPARLRIIDSAGHVVMLKQIAGAKESIDLPTGLYIIELGGDTTITRKVAIP